MSQAAQPLTDAVPLDSHEFVDRRGHGSGDRPQRERRQFADSREELPQEIRELAEAIDRYKLKHHRRFITVDELYGVITALGYHR
jgi:hypothetical protein